MKELQSEEPRGYSSVGEAPHEGASYSSRPCADCHDTGVVFAWWLIDGDWVEGYGPCECLDEGRE